MSPRHPALQGPKRPDATAKPDHTRSPGPNFPKIAKLTSPGPQSEAMTAAARIPGPGPNRPRSSPRSPETAKTDSGSPHQPSPGQGGSSRPDAAFEACAPEDPGDGEDQFGGGDVEVIAPGDQDAATRELVEEAWRSFDDLICDAFRIRGLPVQPLPKPKMDALTGSTCNVLKRFNITVPTKGGALGQLALAMMGAYRYRKMELAALLAAHKMAEEEAQQHAAAQCQEQ